MSDIFILLINAKNNKRGDKSFLFTPSDLGRGRSNNYWLLPPSTNEIKTSSSYYKKVIKKLIEGIFANKRVIDKQDMTDAEYIKEYIWDGKIINLQDKPLSPENYPSISSLLENNFGIVNNVLTKANQVNGKLLLVNITYYLEKVNATAMEKIKNNCEYHKTMLKSHLNINQKGEYVYNEKTKKVEYKKEPILNAVLRNMFGSELIGGFLKKRTKKNKNRKIKNRKKKKTYKKF